MNWIRQEDEPLPTESAGQYMAWVALDRHAELRLVSVRVFKISNGTMATMDGSFMHDYLGRGDRIVTWAHAPPPPNWSPDEDR